LAYLIAFAATGVGFLLTNIEGPPDEERVECPKGGLSIAGAGPGALGVLLLIGGGLLAWLGAVLVIWGQMRCGGLCTTGASST